MSHAAFGDCTSVAGLNQLIATVASPPATQRTRERYIYIYIYIYIYRDIADGEFRRANATLMGFAKVVPTPARCEDGIAVITRRSWGGTAC